MINIFFSILATLQIHYEFSVSLFFLLLKTGIYGIWPMDRIWYYLVRTVEISSISIDIKIATMKTNTMNSHLLLSQPPANESNTETLGI